MDGRNRLSAAYSELRAGQGDEHVAKKRLAVLRRTSEHFLRALIAVGTAARQTRHLARQTSATSY